MFENKNYLLSIFLISVLFFMVAFISNIQNPVGLVIKQYSSSNILSQLGNFSIYIAYFFVGIPAGIILSKWGYRKTLFLSLIMGVVGFTAMILGCNLYEINPMLFFIIYLLGTFISGCCVCIINTVVNPFANKLGSGGNKGNQLIQFGTFTSSLAAIFVSILCGHYLGSIASSSISNLIPIFLFEAIILIIILFFIYFMDIDESNDFKENKEKISYFGALKYPHFLFGLIAIFCYLGVEVGVPNICNLYLVNEFGLETIVAGGIVSLFYFFMMFGRLCGFFIGSKISSNKMLKYASLIGSILIILSIISPLNILFPLFTVSTSLAISIIYLPIGVFFIIIGGLFFSIMWGSLFNLAIKGLGKYTENASGILMVMLCGGGILPLIQAFIVDLSGSYLLSFIFGFNTINLYIMVFY